MVLKVNHFGLFLLFALVSIQSVHSQNEQQIKLGAASSSLKVSASEDRNVLSISTSISLLNVRKVRTKGGEFIELGSQDLVKIFGKGQPNIPVYSKVIEVPLEAVIDFEIIGFEQEIVELKEHNINKKIIPAQPSLSKSDDPEKIPFYYDEKLYQKDAYLDTQIVEIENLGIMRSARIARIQIKPIQYNPVQNKLRILNNLTIRINFIEANHLKTKEMKQKYSSRIYESLLSNFVLNIIDRFKLLKTSATYVIVSDPDFESTMQPFIQWKQSLGYDVIEAYTDQTSVGNTTTSIKNYLEDLYNNPPPGLDPPEYILFVGDIDQIPSFNGTQGSHITDFYYCEYTGDMLPDVFYGRFSANNVTELEPQIEKTLKYGKYLKPYPSYIYRATLVAGADASHATTYGNGQINYGENMYFNSSQDISANTYLQPEPYTADYSTDIISDINNGVGFANYTAHCSADGWSNPSFSTSDIGSLTNLNKYGLWVGNCCKSNKFNVYECFGEAALRAEDKGAIGYIGGTNSTYWDEDFWWAVGFKSISSNPAYDANHLGCFDKLFHTHSESSDQWCTTQGQLLWGGNLAVDESTSSLKTYYWEIYQLMGDPSLKVKIASRSVLIPPYRLFDICDIHPELCRPIRYIPPWLIIDVIDVRDHIYVIPLDELLNDSGLEHIYDNSGLLKPMVYNLKLSGIEPDDWNIQLFNPEGEAIKLNKKETRNGMVINFSPVSNFAKLGLIGNYMLAVHPKMKLHQGKNKIKIKLTQTPYRADKIMLK